MARQLKKLMWSKVMTQRLSVALAALVCATAGAVEIDVELEVGIGHTDNISRVSDLPIDPAIEDTIYDAGVTVSLDHESVRSSVDLRGSLLFHDYQDAPYDSETLPALDLASVFRITEQSLSWFLDGNVGQQSIDPFQPVTPENRENFSFITTGPSLFIPLGSRFSVRTDLNYSVIDYEERPLDNSRKGAQLSFVRQINPTRTLSLNVRGEQTDFDQDALFEPIDRYDAFLQFSTTGSRNNIDIDLGWSIAERAGSRSEEPLINVNWTRQVSRTTSITVSAGSQISDSAESFRTNQQSSIEIGDVQDQQGITDPFTEDYAGLSMTYLATKTTLILAGRLIDEDYLNSAVSARNRQIQRLSASLTRRLGTAWEVGLEAQQSRHDYEELGREDVDFLASASLTWRRLRTIAVEFRIDRIDRESELPLDEYTENRVYLGLHYTPDIGN